MSEKIKVIKVILFLEPTAQNPSTQKNIYVPVDSIAFLTEREANNPRNGFNVHFKIEQPSDMQPIKVKSINPGFLSAEQVEVLKSN